MEDLETLAKTIAESKYSIADKKRFSRIIREFNELYHSISVQTWKNTKWRGVNVYKAPTDLWIYQELIQAVMPDLIVETGTFEGGSALYMRDMMDLMELDGMVVTIGVDLSRIHEKVARRIGGDFLVLKGSSTDPAIVEQVKEIRGDWRKTMVILDSDHKKSHVAEELRLYGPLVSKKSVLIVEDTNAAKVDDEPGPLDAVNEFLETDPGFVQDVSCEKFMLTFNRDGYLERV